MRKKLIIIVIIVVLAGLSVYAYTRSHSQQGANGGPGGAGGRRGALAPGQAIPVSVATARSEDVPVYLDGLGSVEAFNTVTVKSRVDGPITEINFKEGQDVKAGELLAEIDPRQFQVAVSQADATLYRDQSQLTIAQRNFARYEDLFKQGIVSQQDYDAQESTKGQLEGTVRADQANIDNAKLNLSYTKITSPINGKVGLRQVDIGNVIHASDTNGIAVITQLQPIAIIFTIPEDSLPSVLEKFHGSPLEVDIYSRDNQTKLGTASLVTINNQIDPTTGTVKLKAISQNKDGLLWPSQFVNARLLLDVKKDATVVPAAAVQHGSQGAFAFVMKPDSTVDMRTLQPGIADGNQTVIDQGLAPGEVVVTDGQDKLSPGSKVTTNTGDGSGQGNGGRRNRGGQQGQGMQMPSTSNAGPQAPTGQNPNAPNGQQQPNQQQQQRRQPGHAEGDHQRRGNK